MQARHPSRLQCWGWCLCSAGPQALAPQRALGGGASKGPSLAAASPNFLSVAAAESLHPEAIRITMATRPAFVPTGWQNLTKGWSGGVSSEVPAQDPPVPGEERELPPPGFLSGPVDEEAQVAAPSLPCTPLPSSRHVSSAPLSPFAWLCWVRMEAGPGDSFRRRIHPAVLTPPPFCVSPRLQYRRAEGSLDACGSGPRVGPSEQCPPPPAMAEEAPGPPPRAGVLLAGLSPRSRTHPPTHST